MDAAVASYVQNLDARPTGNSRAKKKDVVRMNALAVMPVRHLISCVKKIQKNVRSLWGVRQTIAIVMKSV